MACIQVLRVILIIFSLAEIINPLLLFISSLNYPRWDGFIDIGALPLQ